MPVVIFLAQYLDIIVNFLTVIALALGAKAWVRNLHGTTLEKMEERHKENREALWAIREGLSDLKPKVDAMWVWFTSDLERRQRRDE